MHGLPAGSHRQSGDWAAYVRGNRGLAVRTARREHQFAASLTTSAMIDGMTSSVFNIAKSKGTRKTAEAIDVAARYFVYKFIRGDRRTA